MRLDSEEEQVSLSVPSKTIESSSGIMDVTLDASMGLNISALEIAGSRPPRDDASGYWSKRCNNPIYLMTILFASFYCRRKMTVADIGCHCSPLVLMLPEFKKRFAIDPSRHAPALWEGVDGATFINTNLQNVDVKALTGEDKFDLIICHQVIEHIEDAAKFAHDLCSRGRRVIVSTTFETPAGHTHDHVQDPISLRKFESWFPRKALCHFIHRAPVMHRIVGVF